MCLYCHRIGCEHPWTESMTGTVSAREAMVEEYETLLFGQYESGNLMDDRFYELDEFLFGQA